MGLECLPTLIALPLEPISKIIGFFGLNKYLDDNPFLDDYPLSFVKLVCFYDSWWVRMRSILEQLKRTGIELSSGYAYQGVNPHTIRTHMKAASEEEDFKEFADCMAFAIVSGLYGTKVPTMGLNQKKAPKFGEETHHLTIN